MSDRADSLLPAETASAAETRGLGLQLGAALPDGTVLALEGDLGAGKTHLVKGIVDGLGGEGDGVSSPTFTIAQEYSTDRGMVLHVDAYRVEDIKEFVEMGLSDRFEEACLVAVEWPERMGAYLPGDAIGISIRHLGGDRRQITRS